MTWREARIALAVGGAIAAIFIGAWYGVLFLLEHGGA